MKRQTWAGILVLSPLAVHYWTGHPHTLAFGLCKCLSHSKCPPALFQLDSTPHQSRHVSILPFSVSPEPGLGGDGRGGEVQRRIAAWRPPSAWHPV